MKKFIIVLLVLLLLLGGGSVAGWFYVQGAPQYSLYKMYQAAANRDYQAFSTYFDTEAVIDTLVEEATDKMKSNLKAAFGDIPRETLDPFVQGMILALKPTLKEELRTGIKKGVEEGNFQTGFRPVSLFAAFQSISVSGSGSDKEATVTGGREEKITLKIRDRGNSWQIYETDVQTVKTFYPDADQSLTYLTLGANDLKDPKERDERRIADLATIERAVRQHRDRLGYYPLAGTLTTPTAPTARLTLVLVPTFLSFVPNDPSASEESPYVYWVSADGQHFVLYARLEDPTHEKAITKEQDQFLPDNYNYRVAGD